MGSKKVKKKVRVKKGNKVVKIRRFNLKGIDIPRDINHYQTLDSFSQIRESYFNYLQNVIKENLESADSESLPNESLEKISLEVEQQALLACLQSDIYQRIMIKIIHDIKKSTQQMKLHLGIKNILLSKNLEDTEILPRLKREDANHAKRTSEETGIGEVYSHIPTISSVRPNYNEYDQDWSGESVLGNDYVPHMLSVNNFNGETNTLQCENDSGSLSVSCEAQDIMQAVYSPSANEHYLSSYNNGSSKCISSIVHSAEKQIVNKVTSCENENAYMCSNLVPVQTTSSSEEMYNRDKISSISAENQVSHNTSIIQTLQTNSELDPILKSRNQLQKSVEMSLKNLKEINVQKEEEQERARIARILEDNIENEIDDNQYDSLSDNCDEFTGDSYKDERRSDNLLADRLEEMRQIFGVQDETEEKVAKNTRNDCEVLESEKYVRRQKMQKYNHIWYHERLIQMYKLSLLSSEMTAEMRERNRSIFFECFGEDSDEENEINFLREDKYLLSCKERISSWVVKYLMPFYQKKRIVGRNVFKSLGHHVSNSIIQQIQYPDEWTVKYLVSKFFPTNKTFVDESDVIYFQIE